MVVCYVKECGVSLSVIHYLKLGNSLSLRVLCQLVMTAPVVDYLKLGSSLSIRTIARVGSIISAIKAVRFG